MGSLRLFVKSSHGPERLCALTDGVYAIALTLLVLDLKAPELPEATDSQLTEDLIRQGHNFLAYIISFVAVTYFWIQHHRVFSSVGKCDQRIMIHNFVHLLFISLMPYTASLIGHYEADQVAVIMFSATLGLAGLAGTTLLRYISQKGVWAAEAADGIWVTLPWWSSHFAALIAAVSILASFASTTAALLLWLILPLRNFLVLRRLS